MGVGVQVPPRTPLVSYRYRKCALNLIGAGCLNLPISIGHRVDVLNLSYGGNREYPIAGAMPRGVTVVLVRNERRTTAEEHDAFSGLASAGRPGVRHRGAAVAMQLTTNASCAEVPPG